ncbi:MAG: glycosyltransferase [Ferruginibacter sp.]|nr:glycosyltransferase [Ferruginibacter sp.]
MKQKILICVNSLEFGGTERVVSILLNHLQTDFELHLALYYNIQSYPIPSDIKILQLRNKETGTFKSFLFNAIEDSDRLYRYCKENDIHTVVVFLHRFYFLSALMKMRKNFSGRIIMCHRTHTSKLIEHNPAPIIYLKKRIMRWCLEKADLVLANSNAIKEDLERNYLKNKSVQVIVNPIEIEQIREKAKEPIRIEFRPELFNVVVVARLRKEKDHLGILEACRYLETAQIKVWFIGSGELEQLLKEEARNKKVDQMIEFVGAASNPFPYIANADLVLLNSYVEGLPNVILEAMACKKAVVSTDCESGPREILTESGEKTTFCEGYEITSCGILIPVNNPKILANALIRIKCDNALRHSMEEMAALRVKKFDISMLKPKFANAFSDIRSI